MLPNALRYNNNAIRKAKNEKELQVPREGFLGLACPAKELI